jgi:hypothetical protein
MHVNIEFKIYIIYNTCKFYVTSWGSSPALNFGKKYMVYLQKGKKKLDVNSISGENCMILQKFSLGKQPFAGPCY